MIGDFFEPLSLPEGLVLCEREGEAQACTLESLLNATHNLGNIRIIKTGNHQIDNASTAFPEPLGRATAHVSALFDDLLDACPGSRRHIRSAPEHARNGRNRDTGSSGE